MDMDLFHLQKDERGKGKRLEIMDKVYDVERKSSLEKLEIVNNYLRNSPEVINKIKKVEECYDKTVHDIKQDEINKQKKEYQKYLDLQLMQNRLFNPKAEMKSHENNLKQLIKKGKVNIKNIKIGPTIFETFKKRRLFNIKTNFVIDRLNRNLADIHKKEHKPRTEKDKELRNKFIHSLGILRK